MVSFKRFPDHIFKKVLIIDDDLSFVKLIKDNLQEEGYTVYCGFDGHMGIELAHTNHPDVILMDVSMPFMNGLQAFKHLRADQETARIPVVFISSVIPQIIRSVVDTSPRAAHLKKPIDLIELASFLRQFIQLHAA